MQMNSAKELHAAARDPATAPTLLDEVPEEDRVPDYPPWPGSPAAAGGG